MSREMDLWVRDAQVQQQRYDDERRKTDAELEPLLIKLQVRLFETFSIRHAAIFKFFSRHAHRLRAKLQLSIDCRSRQRVLQQLVMRTLYFSFSAKYQTNINKSDLKLPPPTLMSFGWCNSHFEGVKTETKF